MTEWQQRADAAREQTLDYMQRKLWAYKQWKEKTDTEYANQQSAKRESDTMNLYKSWLEATDEQTKQRYNTASRANLLAEMISNKAREKGIEMQWNAKDIVSSYLQGFPDDYQKLVDFTHSNQDPEEFAIEMWWMQAPEKESSTFTNIVGWAYDSATWIPRMIGKWAANAIWWVAKQFWADDERVNELVQSYKDYLDSDWSAEAIGADTDSGAYKASKVVSDLAQTAALWKLWGMALESKLWMPLATADDALVFKAMAWATEWAADMWIYSMVSDSELPSGKDLALWAWLWAAVPIAWAVGKAASKAIKTKSVWLAEDLLQNVNRMTKSEQSKFAKRYGEKVGKWLNDRWLQSWDDIIEYFTNSKNKVDNALSAIEWRFTSKELNDVLDDVVDFAIETKNPQSSRMIELLNKNAEWGLTMSEINEVKRFFEAHNKFNYLTKWTAKQSELATNMDSALREWQYKIAEQNWFSNLAELNRETAAAKEILNWVKKWEAWVVGNNPISLTDIIVAAGWWINPEHMAMAFLKKWLETPTAKRKMVDILNWIGGHETMAEKVADLERIAQVNTEKELDRLYKERWVWDATPKLPQSYWVDDWGKNILVGNDTFIWTPEWRTVVKEKVTELPSNP